MKVGKRLYSQHIFKCDHTCIWKDLQNLWFCRFELFGGVECFGSWVNNQYISILNMSQSQMCTSTRSFLQSGISSFCMNFFLPFWTKKSWFPKIHQRPRATAMVKAEEAAKSRSSLVSCLARPWNSDQISGSPKVCPVSMGSGVGGFWGLDLDRVFGPKISWA